jgi:hypothetical protein
VTGLERESLRQAIHDVRGPLNTCSVLADLVGALLDRDPALARSKAAMVVRELQTVARMLDHLVGASDTLAPDTTSNDLRVALAKAIDEVATKPTVRIDASGVPATLVDASGAHLPRLLKHAIEGAIASLPDGGDVTFTAATRDGLVRLVITVRGDRVVAAGEGRPRLAAKPPAAGWLPGLALGRGNRGDVRLLQETGQLRVEIDLRRATNVNP